MNQVLSDEEITLIVRESARGSAINRDGGTSQRIARAIEAAVLAKFGEPVAIYEGKEGEYGYEVITSYEDIPTGTDLYALKENKG